MQGVGHVHETAEIMPIALAEIGHTTEKEGCDDDGISHGGPHNYAVFCEVVQGFSACSCHQPVAFGRRCIVGNDVGRSNLRPAGAALCALPVLEEEHLRAVCTLVLFVLRRIADSGIRIAPDTGDELHSSVVQAVALRRRNTGDGMREAAREPAVCDRQPNTIIALGRNKTVLCPYIVRRFLLIANLLRDNV